MSANRSAFNTLIDEAIGAVTKDAGAANVTFSTTNELVGVCEVRVRTTDHEFTVDEPTSLGGGGVAPNPVEFALASLGSCQAITYRFWSERLGIPFDHLSIQVEGDLDVRGFFALDKSVRPGFKAVRVTVKLEGTAGEEVYAKLHETVDRYCPVLDIFQGKVPVTTRLL